MPMLKSITEIAMAHGAIAQVAVEESMACGIGVCMTCVMPVKGKDGLTRMARSCAEGPVFRGDRIRRDAQLDRPTGTRDRRLCPRRSGVAQVGRGASARIHCR